IVFIGDSITDGACWDELFPDLPVKNRGINADTTAGVLQRLPDILEGKPSSVFILIGTNDLPWFMYRTQDDILGTYDDILTRCQEDSPETKVFIQSILPRNRRYSKKIKLVNKGLEKLAKKHGFIYIDLFTHFVGKDGGLRDDFTNDHLHLMAEGYKRWVEILEPYLVIKK
ncbi:MAG: sialate O-acetylesterase, partial [Anaerolineaceae bacterium]|nr:sialate O-acetylesterase [Anaerolineaceae bacterium]